MSVWAAPEFTLRFEVQQCHFNDLVKAGNKQVFSAWRRYGSIFAPPFAAAIVGALVAQALQVDVADGAVAGLGAWCAGFFAAYFIRCVPAPQALNPNGMVLGEARLFVDGEGVTLQKRGHNSQVSWAAIEQLIEEADTLLLMTDRTAAILVPRTAFKDTGEEEAFKDFVIRMIYSAAKA